MSDNDNPTDQSPVNGRIQAAPDSARSEEDSDWSARLWDDSWEGQTGLFGDAHLCVATKKWSDGTVDVLVAHNPDADVPTAYAHRHGENVTPLTVHGLAVDVIETVTEVWGAPQERETEFHGT